MSRPHRPGAGDLYDVFLDRRMRARGGPGNGSQVLLQLDGDVDPDDLRARLDRLAEACPPLTAGLRAWPAWRWVPRPGHRIPLDVIDWHDTAEALYAHHFGRPFLPLSEPSFHVVLARSPGRSWLVIRWLHVLMDAPGADLLLRILDGDDPAGYRLVDEPATLPRRARGGGWLRYGVAVHNFLLRYLWRSLPAPFQHRSRAHDPELRLLSHSFDAEQTAALRARAAELGAALEVNHAWLGLTFLAAARVLRPGRLARLLVPCPINLRPPVWRGPIFTNYFTSVLLHLPARALTTPEASVSAVRAAFRRALRRGEDAAAFWIMGLARYLPYPLMLLMSAGPTGRDPASLYYSNVEFDLGGDGRLFGLEVSRCLATSTVMDPPGASVVFVRCGPRLTVEVTSRGFDRAEPLLQTLVDLLQGGD